MRREMEISALYGINFGVIFSLLECHLRRTFGFIH